MDDEKTPPTGPTESPATTGDGPVAGPATSGDGTPKRRGWDRSTRNAALLSALVAVPVTVAVAGFTFASLAPDDPAEPGRSPSPGASAVGPQATTPVEMTAVPLAERPATVCRALLSQLPATVGGLPQRPVTAGAEQNAAYGDPAVTVACGVPEPTFPPETAVWVVDRVCWYASERADATVLTTVDREVAVQVSVPRTYGQPLQWAAPVAQTVVASVPSGGDVPAGCQG